MITNLTHRFMNGDIQTAVRERRKATTEKAWNLSVASHPKINHPVRSGSKNKKPKRECGSTVVVIMLIILQKCHLTHWSFSRCWPNCVVGVVLHFILTVTQWRF